MKKVLYLFIGIFVIGCSKPSDCVESTGKLVTKMVDVSTTPFTKIKFYNGIAIVLTDGLIPKVEIQTGENLMSDIDVKVIDYMLIIKDNTTCNWVRDYGQTVVYITAPNITDIISKSEKGITSNGILTYPNLRLEALEVGKEAGTGDFNLQIINNQLIIESNNVANFHISGQTIDFSANFYEGNGRIEAANFLVQNINLYHRGSNDMIVNPKVKIEGNMYSTGDVLCKGRPAINTVVSHYIGKMKMI
jgi:Putative auto-transporter adhesin, head GIN domain